MALNTIPKSPILSSLALGSGQITYDDFPIELGHSLGEQIALLKEDLIQIEYPNEVIVDIGWYPSFDIRGHFQIRVVKGGEWERPVLLMHAPDLQTLQRYILAAIRKANNESMGSPI